MKKFIFFAILTIGFISISSGTTQAQWVECLEGDYAPDSYFQCVNGQICAGDECVAPSEVEPTYVPSGSIIQSPEDEVWHQTERQRYKETNGQLGCHSYTTCVISESVNSTGGCSGISCGQAAATLPGITRDTTDSLTLWGKYEIDECRYCIMPEYSLKTPICPPSLINTNYFYYIKSRLYSNADKCTNIASSNQCLVNEQNKGLWSGSCEGGSGNFYKCCCNNQTNNPTSSVPYYGDTNDNYPPPEGVCPIGSRREWRNGAEINPNECANICNPTPTPDPTAPLFCDLSQNCKYGTLEELGVSPVLASIRLDDKTLRKDISQEKCLYLCRDVYTCEDKTLVPQKGKYTSHEECVAGTGFECFGPNDTEYRDCPEGTVSGIGFWRFDPDLNSCVFAGSFENQAECEETFGICYATKEECEGSLKQFYRCDPVYSCLSTKFESEDQCKAKYGTCYDFLNSCMSSCRTSGGESCNLPSDTGSGLTLTVQDNENHCVTATDNQATITWNAASSASCGPGETKENQEITCRSLCGNWTTKTSSGGQEDVNPARTTEYGIQCELDYECCTYTDVYGEPYDCDVNGQNCKRDVIGTDRDCSDHSASRSRKTEVRVVGKPTINEFSSNPTDILYSSGEIGLRKYSTLEWNASADYLGSKTALSCNMSIVSGDSSSRTGTNPLLSQGEERAIPQITTNYSLICRNKDDVSVPDPSCFLDSDPEEALVRVFGAGIREEGPPAGTFKGIDSLFGEIVKAFTLFREGQWPQY